MSPFFFSYCGQYSVKMLYFKSMNKMFQFLPFLPYEVVSIRNKLCRRKYKQRKPMQPIFAYKANLYNLNFHQIERIFYEGEKRVIYQKQKEHI